MADQRVATSLEAGMLQPAFPLEELQRQLAAGQPLLSLTGLSGAGLAYLLSLLPPPTQGPRVVVVPDGPSAELLARDLRFFLGESASGSLGDGAPATGRSRSLPGGQSTVLELPVVDVAPYASLSPDRRTMLSRLRALTLLSDEDLQPRPRFFITAVENLTRRVMPKATLRALTLWIGPGDRIVRDQLARHLAGIGYSRVQLVEEPGCFSVRGGTVDIFSPLYPWPCRLELWDEEVDGLRFFDPDGQRSREAIDMVVIPPAREEITLDEQLGLARERVLEAAARIDLPAARTRQILADLTSGIYFFGVEALLPAFHRQLAALEEYLPRGSHRVLVDPTLLREQLEQQAERAAEVYASRQVEQALVFPPAELLVSPEEVQARLDAEPRLTVGGLTLGTSARDDRLFFSLGDRAALVEQLRQRDTPGRISPESAPTEETGLTPFGRLVHRWLRDGFRVGLVVASRGRAERVRELLKGYGFPVTLAEQPFRVDGPGRDGLVPQGLRLVQGELSAGLTVASHGLLLVTDAELFGERVRRAPRGRHTVTEGMLAAFQELREGDLVVHAEHGVGRYQALVKRTVGGLDNDFLLLEYSGSDKLYLPISRLDQIHRYVGAGDGGAAPALDRLGGSGWQKTRRRVRRGIEELAQELLKVHASRKASRGIEFPQPDEIFHEFEARFPFEETPDQEAAIQAVLRGMTSQGCMDHLVCGDVGYGKTEVAVRAAFLAALGGAQVVVLCPTTVLAAQHLSTFRERYRGFPIHVAGLTRFTPTREVAGILRQVEAGQVDVLIGTHRLLSRDVRFKKLGLVVIDEEQRFGVKQKEQLKALRAEIDILTLTATPIPRTLNMALSGLKEISIIATPPVDRQSIRTFITQWEPQVIREAILQELSRGGQVFYVHNRVQHLPEVHRRLTELVPEARLAVAHGQMTGSEVEQVMLRFVAGEVNVLLCTAIIESGLDIPRANTMVVEDAHTFGLAQLYQLRGRVGRSKQRAFAYLVVPPRRSMSEPAIQRLEALQRFNELGAGFQIASLDLEIRGAGDLLGPEQSGNVNAVGFELYTRMLEEAVLELQGQAPAPQIEPELKLNVSARLPEEYLPDTGLRLGIYKRLSRAEDREEVGSIFEELIDRFGPPPPEVRALAQAMEIKALARQVGIRTVERREGRVQLDLGAEPMLGPDQVMPLLQRPQTPWRCSPEMVLSHPLLATSSEQALGEIRDALLELVRHAKRVSA